VISEYEHGPHDAEVPPWILPPSSCQFLEDVGTLLPSGSSAFEFGSGCSTHALRRAFGTLTSVESSAEWLQRTEEANASIAKRPSDFATVVPLRRWWNRLRLIESFDLEACPNILHRLQQARFILVDSPPNPAKREHALFLTLGYAPAGAIVVLDDLEVRAVSRFTCRLAKQNSKLFRFWILNIDHKLGIFLKLRSGRIRSWPSLIEFVGTWLRA
jgi:hypothetical protein